MKQVTLYTTQQKLVNTHSGYIPFYEYFHDPVKAFNSSDVFSKSDVKVSHLPIRRFCYQDEDTPLVEFFTAFDPKLQEVIDLMKTEEYRKGMSDGKDVAEMVIDAQTQRIKDLLNRSIWDMIKLKFKRKEK